MASQKLAQKAKQHPSFPIVASFPGAGPMMNPRLLAVLGIDTGMEPTPPVCKISPEFLLSSRAAARAARSKRASHVLGLLDKHFMIGLATL